MLKKILSVIFFAFISLQSFAQVEITPFGGWLWTGSIAAYRQDIKISDKTNYGITAGYRVQEQMIVEFEYNRTENSASFFLYEPGGDLGERRNVPLTMNYYMLGFEYEASYDQPFVPYGLFNLGALHVSSEGARDISSSSNTYFVVGLGGGFKYYFNDVIGIKGQARLLFPMQFGGVGFGCGIGTGGGGCGAGVSTYTSIIQGDFVGGIVLRIGK